MGRPSSRRAATVITSAEEGEGQQPVDPLHSAESRSRRRRISPPHNGNPRQIEPGVEVRGESSEADGHEAEDGGEQGQAVGRAEGSAVRWFGGSCVRCLYRTVEPSNRRMLSRPQHPHHQDRQQHHRVQQVHDDYRRGQLELHDHRPQQDLNDQESRGSKAGRRQRTLGSGVSARRPRTGQRPLHAHQARDPAVADLDQGWQIERRKPLLRRTAASDRHSPARNR